MTKPNKKSPAFLGAQRILHNEEVSLASSNESSEVFDRLGKNDVLLGRGNGIAHHPGNISFRRLVWSYRGMYEEASRDDKRCVALQVIGDLSSLDPPGRFVEFSTKHEGKFELVTESRAIEKTCQALREKKINPPTEGLTCMDRLSISVYNRNNPITDGSGGQATSPLQQTRTKGNVKATSEKRVFKKKKRNSGKKLRTVSRKKGSRKKTTPKNTTVEEATNYADTSAPTAAMPGRDCGAGDSFESKRFPTVTLCTPSTPRTTTNHSTMVDCFTAGGIQPSVSQYNDRKMAWYCSNQTQAPYWFNERNSLDCNYRQSGGYQPEDLSPLQPRALFRCPSNSNGEIQQLSRALINLLPTMDSNAVNTSANTLVSNSMDQRGPLIIPLDFDNLFSCLPPKLTAFASGMYSGSQGLMNYGETDCEGRRNHTNMSTKNHPFMACTERSDLESPTTVIQDDCSKNMLSAFGRGCSMAVSETNTDYSHAAMDLRRDVSFDDMNASIIETWNEWVSDDSSTN